MLYNDNNSSLGALMNYHNNKQGLLRKNLQGELAYESFVPTSLQNIIPLELDDETIRLLGTCSRKIGELEGMIKFVPNAQMFLAMYVRKEALLSAQIEGTQCTFDDILDPNNSELTKREIVDVVNYVAATEYAISQMNQLPLCMRLLKEVHATFLSGSRGSDKQPGEIRTSQNWIGPNGCMLRAASYVPPNPEDMIDCLGELDQFINEVENIDPLIKAALIHYQFETIHPFLDGNGRLGRLLITLSLMNDSVLSGAIFYPSYQFKLRRTEYYEKLMDVRENGTYTSWVQFFCDCLLQSAQDAIRSLESLVALRTTNATAINEKLGRSSANGQRLLEMLEENPIVDVAYVADRLDISRSTANSLVSEFVELNILKQAVEEKKRYRVFLYEDYLNILRKGSDPL